MAAGDSGDVHGEYTPLSSCEESTRPAMGSNDPHRLGLNERGWRPPMRTPTYDVLLGHDEAEAGELIGRRFAHHKAGCEHTKTYRPIANGRC